MSSPAPLRIGIFAPYDLARAGGVRTHIRSQARALRKRGHVVSVHGPASATPEPGEFALGGTSLVRLGGTDAGLGLNPMTARHVARLFEAEPFDVVHVHEPLTPLVPWFVLRRARVPIVGTFHVHREQGHQLYAAGRPFLKTLMARVTYRIAVSDAALRTVATPFPGAYDVVPNGIDVDAFRRPRARPAAFEPGRRHVLCVGRIEPRKGLAHLIRAIARMRDQNPAPRLMVVGDGPDRADLETLARSVNADVRFVGTVSDEDLPAFFQASDIVCAPATGGESFGIVLLEAMACAKPIVASGIDGYTELIGKSGCGLLTPPGGEGAIASALTDLLADEERRVALGARGAALVGAYDWNQIALRLERIYRSVIESRRP